MTLKAGGRVAALVLAVFFAGNASGQKVKVGYDKSVDFSQFKSYTWMQPSIPAKKPLVYASVVGWTDRILQSKGLSTVAKDGDLLLAPAGGLEFGLSGEAGPPVTSAYGGQPPTTDATMWTGSGRSSGSSAPAVPEAALQLTFIDRKSNKIIWSGSVAQKLDMEDKEKSLKLIEKAVNKLLTKFPPEKK